LAEIREQRKWWWTRPGQEFLSSGRVEGRTLKIGSCLRAGIGSPRRLERGRSKTQTLTTRDLAHHSVLITQHQIRPTSRTSNHRSLQESTTFQTKPKLNMIPAYTGDLRQRADGGSRSSHFSGLALGMKEAATNQQFQSSLQQL
jgi:hypothetical protein